MKINDLMVGDYICLDGDENYDCPIQVQQIRYQGVDEIIADSDVYGIDDIIPIPLTEEILVKNGFGKINNQYFFGQVEIKELRDCWVVTINKEDADVDINIHYVHQLQRLLNLCNIDKEIIL